MLVYSKVTLLLPEQRAPRNIKCQHHTQVQSPQGPAPPLPWDGHSPVRVVLHSVTLLNVLSQAEGGGGDGRRGGPPGDPVLSADMCFAMR